MKKIKTLLIIILSFLLLSCGNNYKKIEFLGGSMLPTIKDRDIVNYKTELNNINRSDIVIFKPYTNDNKLFIKRVIGVPGDEIKIENGNIYIKNNGIFEKLDEYYLEKNTKTFVGIKQDEHIYKIPENKYFILGDNREFSTDSRECFSNCIGKSEFVDISNIIGKAIIK